MSLAVAGPAVAVDVEPPSDDGEDLRHLRGWLVQRLYEEGFSIAPDHRSAQLTVALERTRRGIAVRADDELFEIETGPEAVVRLEVLHRARSAAGMPTREPSQQAAAAVTVEFHGTAAEVHEGVILMGLVDAGYVITPLSGEAEAKVCVAYGLGDQAEARAVPVDASCTGSAMRLELVDWARLDHTQANRPLVEAIERVRIPEEGFDSERPPRAKPFGPEPPPELHKRRVRSPFRDAPAEIRLGIDAGVMYRNAFDGSVRMTTRAGLTSGPGGLLAVSLTPSRARGVEAVDIILAVGPDFRVEFGRRKRAGFDIATVFGALVHTFRANGVGSGGRAYWYAGVPMGFSWGIGRGAKLHLWTEAGLSGAGLRHQSERTPPWARTAWSLRGALGFSYGWRIH